MAWVYMLRGSSGRFYIGCTALLERRLEEHLRGSNHTTHRFGDGLELVDAVEVGTMADARKIERTLKRKKNPKLALHMLTQLKS